MLLNEDNYYFNLALKEAEKALKVEEVPVGVIIVRDGLIIAKAHTKKVKSKSVLDHAEIIALMKATKKLNDWRLDGCDMYVTLEPCPMCASAIQQSRIKKVYIGTKSNFKTNGEIMANIFDNNEFYHHVDYEYVNDYRCEKILKDFFKSVRLKRK